MVLIITNVLKFNRLMDFIEYYKNTIVQDILVLKSLTFVLL